MQSSKLYKILKYKQYYFLSAYKNRFVNIITKSIECKCYVIAVGYIHFIRLR